MGVYSKSYGIPSFSIGWLSNSKKRHGLKVRVQHGEAGSVDEDSEGKMTEIRLVIVEYIEVDIYNMEEIGLFWRILPSRGLLTML
jgi:hypothetical protein